MKKIKCMGVLLAVSDIEKTKTFYETVMDQKIVANIEGTMVDFRDVFGLQARYDKIVSGDEEFAPRPTGGKLDETKPSNFQIAFEVDDLGYWADKIKSTEGIELIHDIAEYNWGQRGFRFYDYENNIVEVSESMKIVAERFIVQGLTVAEVAEHIGFPTEYIQEILRTEL